MGESCPAGNTGSSPVTAIAVSSKGYRESSWKDARVPQGIIPTLYQGCECITQNKTHLRSSRGR